MDKLETIKRYNKVMLQTFFNAKKIIDSHKTFADKKYDEDPFKVDARYILMDCLIDLWNLHFEDMKSLTDEESVQFKEWYEKEFIPEDKRLLGLFIDEVAFHCAKYRSRVIELTPEEYQRLKESQEK